MHSEILPEECLTLYKVNSTAAIAQPLATLFQSTRRFLNPVGTPQPPGSIFAPSSAKRPQIFLNNQFHFPINYAKCF
jgi:hypothetical protein